MVAVINQYVFLLLFITHCDHLYMYIAHRLLALMCKITE